jgi:hypothetical protein
MKRKIKKGSADPDPKDMDPQPIRISVSDSKCRYKIVLYIWIRKGGTILAGFGSRLRIRIQTNGFDIAFSSQITFNRFGLWRIFNN